MDAGAGGGVFAGFHELQDMLGKVNGKLCLLSLQNADFDKQMAAYEDDEFLRFFVFDDDCIWP